MKIYMNVDYVCGHARYGHIEGDIQFNKEKEEEFKTLLKKQLNNKTLSDEELDKLDGYKELILDSCHLVVDDWDVEEYRSAEWGDLFD